jgi:hypothetical protein
MLQAERNYGRIFKKLDHERVGMLRSVWKFANSHEHALGKL